MVRIKKGPFPAKGTATVISYRRTGDCHKLQKTHLTGNSIAVRQDAKTLQFLKTECNRTAGRAALQAVFSGLLVVHEANLSEFSKALKEK